MPRIANSKAKTAPVPAANGAAAATEVPESLDQVRDILFGGQMRMVENRLRGLEERLLQEQASLRTEFTRTIGEHEAALRKELHGLAEKLAAERAKRADELKVLGSDLKEALKGLERRHGQLEEAALLADAELRDQVVRLSGALDKSVAELGSRKLDVAALAAILGDAAARLAGDAKPAGKGGARS